jgi:hypothetical protein
MAQRLTEPEPGHPLALHYITLLKMQPNNTADAADIDDVEPTSAMVLPSIFLVDPVTGTPHANPCDEN